MKLVIICGGIGSKIWPLSRESNPKHFAKLVGDKSLFEMNYEVLRQKYRAEDIFVQTNPVQAKIAQEQVKEIPLSNYFIEPERRNHGPAMGLMAAKLFKIAPDEPYMIVQADVVRRPDNKFLEMIEVMDKLIQKEKKLMTGGIKLERAVGGIDFMVPGEDVEVGAGMRVFRMKKWVDRSDTDANDIAAKAGQVYGHANHYAWTPRLMLEAYKRRAPEWYGPLEKIMAAIGTDEEEAVIKEQYALLPADPIEARVTKFELDDALVVECPFEWVDLGTWQSVAEYLQDFQFSKSNFQLEIEGDNNFVRSKKFVATIGMSDLVVVETEDALLVCKKSDSGKVGQVVDWLKEKGKGELL